VENLLINLSSWGEAWKRKRNGDGGASKKGKAR